MALLAELPPDHDLDHLDKALRYCDKFRIAVDGGAHQGIWSNVMAKKFNLVFAFEPVCSNFKILQRESDSNVIALDMALSNKSGFCDMKAGPRNTGQYHVTDGKNIRMIALDWFGFINVDFLKLDIEGYELFALRGARKLLELSHPVVMIEVNGLSERYNYKDRESGDFLKSLGYEKVAQYNKDHVYRYSKAR